MAHNSIQAAYPDFSGSQAVYSQAVSNARLHELVH